MIYKKTNTSMKMGKKVLMMEFYATLIACDRIISTGPGQLLIAIPILIYKALSARKRAAQIWPADIQVNVK